METTAPNSRPAADPPAARWKWPPDLEIASVRSKSLVYRCRHQERNVEGDLLQPRPRSAPLRVGQAVGPEPVQGLTRS